MKRGRSKRSAHSRKTERRRRRDSQKKTTPPRHDKETMELNEMTSGTEVSSLNPNVKAKVESEGPARRKTTQSGDLQAVSDTEDTNNESAAELIEEGQGREAEIVDALEDAPEPDQGEIEAHKVPEKGVPAFKNRNRL